MKAKRLLFLIMAICLTSGVRAQFYDGPDDIYYYVAEYHEHDEYKSTSFSAGYYTGRTLRDRYEDENKAKVLIFNFDGTKAALLCYYSNFDVSDVKSALTKNPSCYEDKVETTEYNYNYVRTSSSGVTYKRTNTETYTFSQDRNTLKEVWTYTDGSHPQSWVYKRVDKSFFKVGRSKTPSGTLYE